MSHIFAAYDELSLVPPHPVQPEGPAAIASALWSKLANDIRKLFELVTVQTRADDGDATLALVSVERILDATAALDGLAESRGEAQRPRLEFSIAQCEQEARRLFDCCIRRIPIATLGAYAERGVMAARGLDEATLALTH